MSILLQILYSGDNYFVNIEIKMNSIWAGDFRMFNKTLTIEQWNP